MKFFIIATLATIATAAKLDKVYLPPNARASGGAGAGLQAPRGGAPGFGGGAPSFGGGAPSLAGGAPGFGAARGAAAKNQAEILKYENEIDEQGFHYAYETSDGTKAEQQGKVIPGAKPEEGSLQVSGSYSYVGDDGQTYSISYTADENGYHAEGAHLPTPPPIPEAILKSLQLTAGGAAGGNGYTNQRSSYDADSAGYQY